MAKAPSFLLLLCLLLAALAMSAATIDAGLSWIPTKTRCQGSIAECEMAGDDEFQMDTEINRRILATSDYISYGALQRDTTPCSKRGASYYNCQTGAEANPYDKGCSEINQCRG